MNYLTQYYKNLSEQLEEKVVHLKTLVESKNIHSLNEKVIPTVMRNWDVEHYERWQRDSPNRFWREPPPNTTPTTNPNSIHGYPGHFSPRIEKAFWAWFKSINATDIATFIAMGLTPWKWWLIHDGIEFGLELGNGNSDPSRYPENYDTNWPVGGGRPRVPNPLDYDDNFNPPPGLPYSGPYGPYGPGGIAEPGSAPGIQGNWFR